jgi:hypothetical protein
MSFELNKILTYMRSESQILKALIGKAQNDYLYGETEGIIYAAKEDAMEKVMKKVEPKGLNARLSVLN